MSTELIIKDIGEACEEYVKIFGANKVLFRVVPSMQDGLRPVARRFLYTLYKGKGRSKYIKMVKAAADTISQFHPHGPTSVEDVGARLASPIANNIRPVDGQGNFGSYKDAKAGSGRYIEVKLSQYGMKCFFEDFESSNVDMRPSYTGDDFEPEYLPARYPHALFNPILSGIGYAESSNIPPYNVTEVLDATIKLIKNPKSKVIIAPDSPTGADVIDNDGMIKKLMNKVPKDNDKDKFTFTLRGHIDVDEVNNILTITSIPLQTTIDEIVRNIVLLKDKKEFDEIIDIKDYTKNKTGVKTIIRLNPSADPYKTIEKLYKKKTGLKKTYPVRFSFIDNFVLKVYCVRTYLLDWIEYRRDTMRSSFNTRLVLLMEEQNINDIMLFMLKGDNAIKTMKIVTNSKNKAEIISKFMSTYNIDSQKANTIANMRVSAFTKDAYEEYKEKAKKLKQQIKETEEILSDDTNIDNHIIKQLEEGIKLFGSPRKSRIIYKDDK